ncbi:MAG: hypothetical protein H6704_13600 [Myxococcales bacterium]|nr:hypothetical protein [Myxococcales bacterium]
MGADDERRRLGPPAGDGAATTGADPPDAPAPADDSEVGFSEPDAAPPSADAPPPAAERYQVGAFLGCAAAWASCTPRATSAWRATSR